MSQAGVKMQVVQNYRYRAPYYIVDRLFGAAELRLGAGKVSTIRISRTDGTKRPSGS